MKKLQNDRYRRVRGGHARLYAIHCAECGGYVCGYQKDGPGSLKRLYLDRMQPEKHGKALRCPNCKMLLGTKMVYKKENRPAFRLFQDAVQKKSLKQR